MRTALAALGWPASLRGAGTPLPPPLAHVPFLGHDCLATASVQVWPCACTRCAGRPLLGAGWVVLTSAALHLCPGPWASELAFCHCCAAGSVSGCRRWEVGGRRVRPWGDHPLFLDGGLSTRPGAQFSPSKVRGLRDSGASPSWAWWGGSWTNIIMTCLLCARPLLGPRDGDEG